jgi:uncharacterized protein YigA (DUF484 family)
MAVASVKVSAAPKHNVFVVQNGEIVPAISIPDALPKDAVLFAKSRQRSAGKAIQHKRSRLKELVKSIENMTNDRTYS